jgi:hypothetical protein
MQPLEEKLKLQRSSLPPSLPPTPQRSHKDQPPLVSHKLPKKNTKISSFSLNQGKKEMMMMMKKKKMMMMMMNVQERKKPKSP